MAELPAAVTAALAGAARPVCAYVYSRAALRERAAAVRAALPAGWTLLYAVKANGHPDVVRTLARECDGLEVASGGELALARAAGARRIVFGGPAKTDAELRAAVDAGALVNVESAHELRRLAWAAAGRGVTAGVRVNRAAAGPSGSHTMTGTPTPFGVDEAQLPAVLAEARGLGVDVSGFHLHAVSNNLSGAAHAAFVAGAVAWSVATAAAHGVRLRYVNAGGGLGVDHRSTATIDLGELRAGLARVAVPPGVDVVLEPGRLLAADAGWYAAEVLDLKRTHGRWFAVLRGGTHHFRLPAAWGYDHPFTVVPVDDWPHPYPRPEVTGVEVDAVGELCTPRDVLCRAARVDRLRAGDVLVFARTGAYGYDISHHRFLRHPEPEFLVV
ncbi:alanine racemase [Spirilliplanes yamanashiensis]|uniref:Staphyloferrin B biosynthesis decarboxylase SbnH n=1 Tax=Spirilliplanes yamanashiensis TaxID=42233 RepID=A0A8J3YA73_9ACTN|nr:alanine racemase [Spirilliplanes yamanashiensis]MDP9817934.1 diaminopimelate decarboxylase [Spirilliplanes yamanashiensis]GIJ04743.1 staphyloferrin B biosynthesis decarboxylase SbnH [Spirilliplanes yamanashiensis]